MQDIFVPYEEDTRPVQYNPEDWNFISTLRRATSEILAEAVAMTYGKSEVHNHDKIVGWYLHILSRVPILYIKSKKFSERYKQKPLLTQHFLDNGEMTEKDVSNYMKSMHPIPCLHVILDTDYTEADEELELSQEIEF